MAGAASTSRFGLSLGCRAGGGTLTGPPVTPPIAGDPLVLLRQDVRAGAFEGGRDV